MGGKRSRDKGKRGERLWRDFLKELGFTDARRGVQYQGGRDSKDVMCASTYPLHYEVKFVESLNVHAALDQATTDAAEEEVPVVAHKRSNEDWKVVLWAEDFFELFIGYLANVEREKKKSL